MSVPMRCGGPAAVSIEAAQADQCAVQMVKMLLDHRADVNAEATIPDLDSRSDSKKRRLQAVHLAAGVGNHQALRLLLDRGAA